jgi:hypothetical protein
VSNSACTDTSSSVQDASNFSTASRSTSNTLARSIQRQSRRRAHRALATGPLGVTDLIGAAPAPLERVEPSHSG